MKRLSKMVLIGLVVSSCVSCDQFTKVLAQRRLAGRDSLAFLGGIVRLSYAENSGAFLGLGSGLSSTARFWLLGALVALILTVLAVRELTNRATVPMRVIGIALLIAGGIGNLIDRAVLGVVRDFLSIGIGPVRTGILNLADLAVTCGAAVIVFSWWHGPSAGSSNAADVDRPSSSEG